MWQTRSVNQSKHSVQHFYAEMFFSRERFKCECNIFNVILNMLVIYAHYGVVYNGWCVLEHPKRQKKLFKLRVFLHHCAMNGAAFVSRNVFFHGGASNVSVTSETSEFLISEISEVLTSETSEVLSSETSEVLTFETSEVLTSETAEVLRPGPEDLANVRSRSPSPPIARLVDLSRFVIKIQNRGLICRCSMAPTREWTQVVIGHWSSLAVSTPLTWDTPVTFHWSWNSRVCPEPRFCLNSGVVVTLKRRHSGVHQHN